jgi:hypothetical protein
MVFLVQIHNDLVFERINPKAFERCFRAWLQSVIETVGVQVVPIDGKTLKGSDDREQRKSALHLVSAWASEHRLVLGQVKVTDKSNEITAIPALLELLDLAGCIITIDAMGTQTALDIERLRPLALSHGIDINISRCKI